MTNLKEQLLSDKDFPKQPRDLKERAIQKGYLQNIEIPWRGITEVLRTDFEFFFYYLYYDNQGHLIVGGRI